MDISISNKILQIINSIDKDLSYNDRKKLLQYMINILSMETSFELVGNNVEFTINWTKDIKNIDNVYNFIKSKYIKN